MAEDWLADVKKYVSPVDEAAVAGIIRHCGIALHTRDASLVSFTDSTETDRVRESFLKRKLGLTDPDAVLDRAIAAVGEQMKGTTNRNRVTVYYLLARHFGKLSLFGGAAAPATAAVESAVGAVNAAAPTVAGGAASVAHLAALGSGTGGSDGSHHGGGAGSSGGGKWWLWLVLLLLLAALLLLLRSCYERTSPASLGNDSDNVVSMVDNGVDAIGNVVNQVDNGVDAASNAIPEGAGVIAGTRNGLPIVTTYFASGKAEVAATFAATAAALKAYAVAHPQAKLSVSGFNDPSGNAALNAQLSKRRAQAVAAALKAAGIPEAGIVLEKPADTTIANTDKAAARRVEVTVKQ